MPLIDTPATYTVPESHQTLGGYTAAFRLTGESVILEADADGLELASDALFADGWLCLPWADVAALVLALTEALAWKMRRGCFRAIGRAGRAMRGSWNHLMC